MPLDFMENGGEMGALIRAHDWAATSIGAPDTWPQALCTTVGLLLSAAQPMYIWWGAQLLCFYNDAYRRSIGPERHPGSLGKPGREVWAEIWDAIGPQIEQVMSGQGAVAQEDALVPITRHGRREQVYWTYSYNPIFDPSQAAGIGGVLVICAETTQEVLAKRQAATELRHLAELFEQAPTFMAMLRGPEHRYELANPAYLRLVGNRELIGRSVAEALPETVEQGFVALLDQVYRTGKPYTATSAPYEMRHSETGIVSSHLLDFVYQPIKDASGTVTGVFVEGADVTGRALMESALRESEARFRDIADATPVLIWISDVTGTCTWFNSRWLSFTGRGMQDEIGVGWIDGVHPQDMQRCVEVYNKAFERREAYRTEYRRRRFDGEWRVLDASGVPRIIDGKFVGFIGSCIDVTERKAAEAELRELNERLEQRVAAALAERKVLVDIIESTDAWVQVLDLNFRILAINRAAADNFERLSGLRPKIGDQLIELLSERPHYRDRAHGFWVRALRGEEFTASDEITDAHGERRFLEMKFNSLRDRTGKLIGAFEFVYDVTDRVRDQARLVEAERHLRQTQKIDAIGQLTGGVAHDFNNLLMVITGGLSLLQRVEHGSREQRIIDQMRQAAERGASLSRQLLAFARRQPLKAEPVDLLKLIDRMRELLDRTLRGDVLVTTTLAQDLWPIHADPSELELVILNLCVNARDAMPRGGSINIGARNGSQLQDAEVSGDFVIVTVADSGTGMSEEVLARVFEPFFTTKEVGKGSGLGLPQVYGFAKESGGSVRIESKLGEGTTVTLFLPRSTVIPHRAEAAASVLDTSARRRALAGSILLVEDDDEVAALVSEMLRELGYFVTRVASAQAALGALADDRPIDLVFSDVMMPGQMNGVDLAREVKRRRPQIGIVLTTGFAGAALEHVDIDNVGLLFKPYELSTLEAALRAARHKHERRNR
jgi:PAS domain S-box-containing protein